MKVTAGTQDRKKIAILGGLVAVAVVVYYFNSSSAPGPVPVATNTPHATVPLVAPHRDVPADTATSGSVRRAGSNQRTLQEFRPTLKPKKAEERPDPLSIDPGLRLDVLGKLQRVNVEGVHRSIFDFSQPPAPKPVIAAAKKPAVPSPLVSQQAQQQQGPVAPPPPAPIPLKFYGYMTAKAQTGPKRAFFLDGEDIQVVNEGDVIKRRYKIVRIGVNSVVVEDLDAKNQQTLPLEAAPAG